MSNFIIPPEEFFASVGEPGGTYANSFEEWQERTQGKMATSGITIPQSNDITLQECPRCKCFHAGGCLEDRESRLIEGGSDV